MVQIQCSLRTEHLEEKELDDSEDPLFEFSCTLFLTLQTGAAVWTCFAQPVPVFTSLSCAYVPNAYAYVYAVSLSVCVCVYVLVFDCMCLHSCIAPRRWG
uniref:Uncharacterized protein n=1 Tax=Physcomitrium patens TaxID=3218 RepID=A0A2K1IDL2_PHYPA|nr:hypothetical protein PHYPA_029512 [Physcomitrium patens]